MKFDENELNDPYWQDQVKTLPSGVSLLLKDIRLALNGEDFKYFEEVGKPAIYVKGIIKEDWTYYFTVFHNSEEFGLPHGQGWLFELPSTIQLLTQLRYVKRLIEADMKMKAVKESSQNKNGN